MNNHFFVDAVVVHFQVLHPGSANVEEAVACLEAGAHRVTSVVVFTPPVVLPTRTNLEFMRV